MKKSRALTKKTQPMSLVKELKKMENVEDLGSAVLHSSHQFYLVIQSILKEKYGFSDKHLQDLNKEVTHAVEGLGYFESKGLHPLSAHSIDDLAKVTIYDYQRLKAARSGLELPTDKEAAKLLFGKKK